MNWERILPGARPIAARCQTDNFRFYKCARRRQQTGWHPAKFIKSTQSNITRFSLTSSFHSIRSCKHYLLQLYNRLFNFCFRSQKIIFDRKVFNRKQQKYLLNKNVFEKTYLSWLLGNRTLKEGKTSRVHSPERIWAECMCKTILIRVPPQMVGTCGGRVKIPPSSPRGSRVRSLGHKDWKHSRIIGKSPRQPRSLKSLIQETSDVVR